jgi:hypothetical protein
VIERTEKKCNSCGLIKPLDEFHRQSNSPDGRQYRCKPCAIAAARQRAIDNPERAREADQRYKQSDKGKAKRKERRDGTQRERILEQKRDSWYRNHDNNLAVMRARSGDPKWVQASRDRYTKWRVRDPRGVHRINIKRLYGLTLEDWDRMVIGQGGRCAICETAESIMVVDHCHNAGHVRALLCEKCNRGLGHFDDTPDHLRAAARYLEAFR